VQDDGSQPVLFLWWKGCEKREELIGGSGLIFDLTGDSDGCVEL
jgi:hypothetical protein